MTAIDEIREDGVPEEFIEHLVTTLSRMEAGLTIPQYKGVSTPKTEAIARSLEGIVQRMAMSDEESQPRPCSCGQGVEGTAFVVPPGPLASAQFECGLSAREELILMKAGISDVVRVCKAVASGDLTQRVTAPVADVIMTQTKELVNNMADKLYQFTSEVSRLIHEFGTDGVVGGQALVLDAEGTWRDLTSGVNKLAANLTTHVRATRTVMNAVRRGDLSKELDFKASGELLELKNTINSTVSFVREIVSDTNRVAREIGGIGILGGQVCVQDAEGSWAELVRNMNVLSSHVTDQVRATTEVTKAVSLGDLSQRMYIDCRGEMLELKVTVNSTIERLSSMAEEVRRTSQEMAEWKLGQQILLFPPMSGIWTDIAMSVNRLAANHTSLVRSVARVACAVAKGDLSKKFAIDVRGEALEIKDAMNTTTTSLAVVAKEVGRVTRELGTEGRLGGQAYVPNAVGVWKDLVDSVNICAANLTRQLRTIASVLTAARHGDTTRPIECVTPPGELSDLVLLINHLIEELAIARSEAGISRLAGNDGSADHFERLGQSVRYVLL